MQVLRPAVTTTLLLGLFCALTPFATTQAPPQASPKPTATAGAGQQEQLSPEEKKKRKDWSDQMLRKPAPKKGCFDAAYPSTEWKEVQCVKAPKIPAIPRRGIRPAVVGNADDVSAGAPSGNITQTIGHFENVTNVTSESGPIGNSGPSIANAYTLQINTDFFTSTAACAGSPNPNCKGWEQWVYWNFGSGSGSAAMQYWLIKYNATCPAGQNWNQFSFTGSTDIYCWKNSANAVAVPNQPITNMGNWRFTGTATSTGDSITMFDGTTAHTTNGDNAVSASTGWTIAEFNIFGAGGNSSGGGTASFNAGASADTRTEIIYGGTAAPNCVAQGFTAEMNNLSFGPTAPAPTTPGPAVIFQESTAGGATSDCAAASTIGDTHLRTFNGLFYDFQAAGDFTLAEVEPNFTVQTRQVSGAPTWPNATVNKAVAARFGKTQVAICLAAPGSDQAAFVQVDGKPTAVGDGKSVELPGGVGIARQNNVYQLTSEEGDSVQATINPGWIGVVVGLGRWPSSVHGLIANPNGNVNQIATRDGFVLTNPFNFDDLYHRFADSWRVTERDSLLSACNREGTPVESGAPQRIFYAGDLEPEIRQKAQGVCTTAGVKPGALLDACTLDVAVIGQDSAANVFVNAIPPTTVGTITSGGGGNILTKWWWLWLILLLIILILWLLFRKKP
ncbi:MAG TPA: hypothetical protein VKQ89_01985 [Candidatus Angelobacter sp.]|nr:hypothetical protein [Candidatus Angelobacter sp.]